MNKNGVQKSILKKVLLRCAILCRNLLNLQERYLQLFSIINTVLFPANNFAIKRRRKKELLKNYSYCVNMIIQNRERSYSKVRAYIVTITILKSYVWQG